MRALILALAGLSLTGVASAQDPPDDKCPSGIRALPADGVAKAANAALRAAPRLYEDAPGKPVLAGAMRADRDEERGPSVKTRCGARRTRQNIIVYLEFPEARGASESSGVLAVARVRGRYRVWFVIH